MLSTFHFEEQVAQKVQVVHYTEISSNGVGTNFGVRVGEARPEGPRAEDVVLGEGTASPSPPTREFTGAL